MNARSFLLVAFLVVIAATAGDQARTAVVTQIQSTAGGVSWTTGSIWDDGLPAQAGNDYVNPAGFTLRTPDGVTNPVFPGDSLTVRGQAQRHRDLQRPAPGRRHGWRMDPEQHYGDRRRRDRRLQFQL